MKTPEELRESLEACFVKKSCAACHYDKDLESQMCLINMCKDAKARIEQLEEENMCMKIQMHGDCGVCKHRSEQEAVFRKAAKKGEFAFTQRCEDCIKNGKSAWEYEGLPEVKSK